MSFFDPVQPTPPLVWAFVIAALLGCVGVSFEIANRVSEGFSSNPYDTGALWDLFTLVFGFLMAELRKDAR